MSFAQAITVERRGPVAYNPDAPNSARLAAFTAEQAARLVPVAADDPAMQYFPPDAAQEFQHTDAAEFTRRYAADPRAVSWGVHLGGELAGVAALRPHASGSTCAELFLGPEFRGRGIGELALAGMMRAAFTPDYLAVQAPGPWGAGQPDLWGIKPPSLELEIRKGNEPSVRLAKRFGFGFLLRREMPGTTFRVSVYRASLGILSGGGGEHDRRQVLVGQAHLMLSKFHVTAEGDVPIADLPDLMLD